jgi:hypothetical protein
MDRAPVKEPRTPAPKMTRLLRARTVADSTYAVPAKADEVMVPCKNPELMDSVPLTPAPTWNAAVGEVQFTKLTRSEVPADHCAVASRVSKRTVVLAADVSNRTEPPPNTSAMSQNIGDH